MRGWACCLLCGADLEHDPAGGAVAVARQDAPFHHVFARGKGAQFYGEMRFIGGIDGWFACREVGVFCGVQFRGVEYVDGVEAFLEKFVEPEVELVR